MSRKLISALVGIVALVGIAALDAFVGVPSVDRIIVSILVLGGGHQAVQAYLDGRNASST